jgi:hypothetical protein
MAVTIGRRGWRRLSVVASRFFRAMAEPAATEARAAKTVEAT